MEKRLAGTRPRQIEPISVRVGDAARITGLCRSKIFRLIASGDLEAVKIGKARVVFVESIDAFLRAGLRTKSAFSTAQFVAFYGARIDVWNSIDLEPLGRERIILS